MGHFNFGLTFCRIAVDAHLFVVYTLTSFLARSKSGKVAGVSTFWAKKKFYMLNVIMPGGHVPGFGFLPHKNVFRIN